MWQTETDTPSSLYTHTLIFTNSRLTTHWRTHTYIAAPVAAGGDERRCERRLAASNGADAHVTDKLTEITTIQVFLCLYEIYGYYYPSSEIKMYIILVMGYYTWLRIIQKQYHPALITHFSVWSVHLAECDKLRKDGFRSSQYYSQGPTFSDPAQSTSSLQDEEDDDIDKKVHIHINTVCKNTHIPIQAVQLTTIEFNGVSLPSCGHTQKCMHTCFFSFSFVTLLLFFFFLNFTQIR